MERTEILATVRTLAVRDTFYRKIYRGFITLRTNNPEGYRLIMEKLEAQHFNDATELVLYFEC